MNSKLNYNNEARKRRMDEFFKKNSENLEKLSSPKETIQEIFEILSNKVYNISKPNAKFKLRHEIFI